MKKIPVTFGIIIAIFIVIGIVKDPLIKSVVTIGATKVIGAPVHIEGFSLGVFKQAIRIKGLKMYNPKGFPEGTIIDLPEISVDYNLPALLKRKLHLKQVVVDLKEVGIVKNKDGKLNVDSLKVVEQEQKPAKEIEKKQKPSKQMPMQIDVLTLSMGKVIYSDFSVGDKPSVQVFDIGINKTYENITSPQALAILILSEPMKQTAIKGAGIYGAAGVLGVGLLPVGVAATLIGKDSAEADFDIAYDSVYNTSVRVVQQMGELISDDKDSGIIKGKVSGCNVTIKTIKKTEKTVQVTVSARKLVLPKPEIASGILHQISEELK